MKAKGQALNRNPRATPAGGRSRVDVPLLRALESVCTSSHSSWPLQDAKAQFSEVVQRALDGEPQVVSRHGKDAVVILSYDAVADALHAPENLFDFLRSSPLVGVDLNVDRMNGGFREVEL